MPGIGSGTYIKAEGDQPKRGPNDFEPANWFHMPVKLGQELLHDYSAARVIHLTAGDGWLMIACLLQRVPGMFLTFGKLHEEKLVEHVVEELFRMCQGPDSGWLHTSSAAVVKDILDFKAEQDKKNNAKVSEGTKKNNAKVADGTKDKLSTPTTDKEGGKDKQVPSKREQQSILHDRRKNLRE